MGRSRKRAPGAGGAGGLTLTGDLPAPAPAERGDVAGAAPEDDAACRAWLWRLRFSPDGKHAFCPRCGRQRRFHRLRSRPSYGCDSCGHQVSPTSGTIFEKSHTSLGLWFNAIALVAGTPETASVRRLADELGVTFGTARRIRARILSALPPAAPAAGGSASRSTGGGSPRGEDAADLVARIAEELRGGAPGWTASRPEDAWAGPRDGTTSETPPVPAKRRRRRGGEANKERILAAACAVIVEKGMTGARVSDIARQAGLSTTIVHYYFATKDDVLFAAIKWQNERDTIRRAAIVAGDQPAVVKLVRFLEESMPPSGFARDEALIRFDLWGKAMRDAGYRDVLRPLREEWRRQIAAMIEEGVANHELHLRAPFAQTLEELTAVLDGYSLQYVVGYRWMSAERLWALLSDYAAHHLGVPRERFAQARTGA